MTVYLFPELPSKKAYKEAIKRGETITALELSLFGWKWLKTGDVVFSGPHYPKPHRYYGKATLKDGVVISVK